MNQTTYKYNKNKKIIKLRFNKNFALIIIINKF